MAEEKVTKLLEEIEKLSVLELNDLVKALEEKFGVTAVAAAPAAATAAAAPAGEEAEEFSEYRRGPLIGGAGADRPLVEGAIGKGDAQHGNGEDDKCARRQSPRAGQQHARGHRDGVARSAARHPHHQRFEERKGIRLQTAVHAAPRRLHGTYNMVFGMERDP